MRKAAFQNVNLSEKHVILYFKNDTNYDANFLKPYYRLSTGVGEENRCSVF